MCESGAQFFLLCRAGSILCALPVAHVTEIMRMLPLEQIADAPEYVLGLSVVRGVPVPVVDVGVIVCGKKSPPTRLVAIKAEKRAIALAVDAVLSLIPIGADALGELPPLLQDGGAEAIAGVGARDSELLLTLRTGRLIPDDVLARLNAGVAP